MTIGLTGVEAVAPRPIAWVMKHPVASIAILLGILAVVAIIILVWTGRHSAEKAATSHASAVAADGTAKATADAQRVVVDVIQHQSAIDAQTRENEYAIRNADGSAELVPPAVAAAGRRALCVRAAYRSEPACQQLLDAHPG